MGDRRPVRTAVTHGRRCASDLREHASRQPVPVLHTVGELALGHSFGSGPYSSSDFRTRGGVRSGFSGAVVGGHAVCPTAANRSRREAESVRYRADRPLQRHPGSAGPPALDRSGRDVRIPRPDTTRSRAMRANSTSKRRSSRPGASRRDVRFALSGNARSDGRRRRAMCRARSARPVRSSTGGARPPRSRDLDRTSQHAGVVERRLEAGLGTRNTLNQMMLRNPLTVRRAPGRFGSRG